MTESRRERVKEREFNIQYLKNKFVILDYAEQKYETIKTCKKMGNIARERKRVTESRERERV